MKPEQRSHTLLGITRSKAKMFEYDVPLADHITVTQDPGRLFRLSIGILGDLAAHGDNTDSDGAADPQNHLQFSARFFDAYVEARFEQSLDPYVTLLGAASFYLCDFPGSALVLSRRIGVPAPDLGGEGLEEFLCWLLQGDFSQGIAGSNRAFGTSVSAISSLLQQYFAEGQGGDVLLDQCNSLRRSAYAAGSPRQLLLADIVRSVVRKKFANSSWHAVPEYTALSRDLWITALQKTTFIRELWPAQHLLGRSGVLRGRSAVVQMPTSAGKTRASELIIRSAFLSGRTSFAVIIAPFRALCHEIKNSFVAAFRNEPVTVDELTDVPQADFTFDDDLDTQQILVVTPEKFVYVLRHAPDLAQRIGVLIFDEGHQFDSGTRGITYELLLTSLKSMARPDAQKVLISAVISNASAVGEWLNGTDAEVVSGTALTPTFRTVAFASWLDTLGRLQFVAQNDPDTEEFFVPRVVESLPLFRAPKEKQRYFPERDDGKDIALFLGLRLVKNGAVAIFCGRKDTAANLCGRAVEVFGRNVALARPSIISDQDETARIVYLHSVNVGSTASSTQSAELGIFSHHGNTPHGIRLSVEHAMRKGSIRFVICTSTLAQGVNLPIRYLIVTSVYQGVERIKVRDFHNLIGRAGRAGMHTEGSILFADTNVFDKRFDRKERWRWRQVKELLEPNNSEPCISALLSFFDPFKSDDAKYSLQLDAMDFLRRYLQSQDAFSELAGSVSTAHADKHFTRQGMNKQIEWKLDVIAAIESFLMSHWDAGETPLSTEAVVALARGTLAYHLAGDQDKTRIETLFTTIADNIGSKIVDPNRRRTFGRTLYGIFTIEEIEAWSQTHVAELLVAPSPSALLDLVWPILAKHIQNETFHKCSKPDELRVGAQAWIAGKSYASLFQTLSAAGARLIWGTKFRDYAIEHIVEIFENGLSYDGALLIGAITELIGLAGSDPSGQLIPRLELLQKMLKYGLPTPAAIALYELGFADRAVVSEICAALNLANEGRGEVRMRLRADRDAVTATLQKFPSYFTHIFDQVL